MYIKQLSVVDGNTTTLARLTLQPPEGGPMEMPTAMFGPTTSANARAHSRLVGMENVKRQRGRSSASITRRTMGVGTRGWPRKCRRGGLKSKDGSGEMVLLRTLSGVADRVKGPPQKLELPEGMPNRTGPSRANPSQ